VVGEKEWRAALDELAKHENPLDEKSVEGAAKLLVLVLPRYVASDKPERQLVTDLAEFIEGMSPTEGSKHDVRDFARRQFGLDYGGRKLTGRFESFPVGGTPRSALRQLLYHQIADAIQKLSVEAVAFGEVQAPDADNVVIDVTGAAPSAEFNEYLNNGSLRAPSDKPIAVPADFRIDEVWLGRERIWSSSFLDLLLGLLFFTERLRFKVTLGAPGPHHLQVPVPRRTEVTLGLGPVPDNRPTPRLLCTHRGTVMVFGEGSDAGEELLITLTRTRPMIRGRRLRYDVDRPASRLSLELDLVFTKKDRAYVTAQGVLDPKPRDADEVFCESANRSRRLWSTDEPELGARYELRVYEHPA
jgi:hypothetical protein